MVVDDEMLQVWKGSPDASTSGGSTDTFEAADS